MSELQSDHDFGDDTDQTEPDEVIENPSDGSDLATETETTEQTEDDSEQAKQDKIQKVINQKHFEKMEAKREAEKYKAELEEYKRKEQEFNQKNLNKIPELPDPYDDDFEKKVIERDQAIMRKAQFDAQQLAHESSEIAKKQQAQAAKQQELAAKAQGFLEKAKSFGMSDDEVRSSAQVIAEFGLSNELREELLGDSDAPLIYKHLANNLADLESLRYMSPFQQARHIDGVIRAKAQALKPKTSKAPQPPTNVKGSGADKDGGRYQFSGGARFE